MNYSVLLSAETERNRELAYEYYLERSPAGAHRWFHAYEKAIDKLVANPRRFVLASESENFPVELRQINFGTSPSRPTHRLLFYVEDNTVVVVTLRHLHQADWQSTNAEN